MIESNKGKTGIGNGSKRMNQMVRITDDGRPQMERKTSTILWSINDLRKKGEVSEE